MQIKIYKSFPFSQENQRIIPLFTESEGLATKKEENLLPSSLLQHNSRCRKQFRGSLGAVRFPADCTPTIVMSLLSLRRRGLRQLGRRISPRPTVSRSKHTEVEDREEGGEGVKRMCTRCVCVCVCIRAAVNLSKRLNTVSGRCRR